MKKITKNVFQIVLIIGLACALTSCRGFSKHADDYVDDAYRYVDDLVEGRKKVKVKYKPRRCNNCGGSGLVQDYYGNFFECPKCGGDGTVLVNI